MVLLEGAVLRKILHLLIFLVLVSGCSVLSKEKKEDDDFYYELYWKDSYEMYYNSCRSGEMKKCFYLGRRLQEGRDYLYTETIYYYYTACTRGYYQACVSLGNLFKKFASGSEEEVKRLYSLACDSGFLNGCAHLYYFLKKIKSPLEEIMLVAEKSCALSDGIGCELAARFYKKVHKKTFDTSEYKFFLEQACELNVLVSCEKLLNLKSISKKEKQKWLDKSCSLGQKEACVNKGRT